MGRKLHFATSSLGEVRERRFRSGGEGIAGVAEHAFGSGLEFLGKPFDMQLAYEELRQGVRKFAMRKPVSGHAQPVERIGTRHVIPEWLQNALEGPHAGRQRSGVSRCEPNGSHRSMVEDDAFALT